MTDVAITVPEKSGTSISLFCRSFVNQCRHRRIRSPEFLALRLREFCGVLGRQSLEDMERIATEYLGVNDIQYTTAIAPASGMHFMAPGQSVISVRADDSRIAQAFTIGHELREMIGEYVKGMSPRFSEAEGDDLETEADVFASTLILGEDAFAIKSAEGGHDPIWLGQAYRFSYWTALLRMFRAFLNMDRPPLFWASVLSVEGTAKARVARCSISLRSPKFHPKSRDQVPNLFFPKRGQTVKLSPNLQRSIKHHKSVYVDEAQGLDYSGDYSLSVLIRPYITGGQVDKLIVLAVPHCRNSLLSEQVLRARPIRIEQDFQLP